MVIFSLFGSNEALCSTLKIMNTPNKCPSFTALLNVSCIKYDFKYLNNIVSLIETSYVQTCSLIAKSFFKTVRNSYVIKF